LDSDAYLFSGLQRAASYLFPGEQPDPAGELCLHCGLLPVLLVGVGPVWFL
jgi:hypothetical protein